MASPILAPAVTLVLWSLVMLFWMALTRLPAMSKAGIRLNTVVGGRGQDLEGVIPDNIQWKAHNYAHLMEQPTLFYAVVLILAVIVAGRGTTLTLAGGSVGPRTAPTRLQAT